MSEEERNRGALSHGDGVLPNGAVATPERDPLDLLCLTRRAALRDCVVVAVCLVSALLGAEMWYYMHANWDGTDDVITLWVLPNHVFTALACGLAVSLTMVGKSNARALGIRMDGMENQVLWGIVGTALSYIGLLAWMGAEWCMRDALFEPNASASATPPAIRAAWQTIETLSVSSALMLLTVGSIMEEILFRGLLLPRLRRAVGRWWPAVVICSLLFGAMHVSAGFLYAIAVAVVSVAFSVVFIRSRSLIAAAISHTLFNIAQYALYFRWFHDA